ncbi:MAG: SWIM zinc finger family protein [Ignavibacteriaceae bacterium]
MNLKDFENQIPSKILERGYSYFKNHHIISLIKEEPGTWFAEVEGNEDYNVTIETEGNDLVYFDCNCPFEGETCKHIAAVLYAVADIEFSSSKSPRKQTNNKRKNVIDDILKKISKEEQI